MRRDSWLGIELRHFAALEAIAHERSFRGAASRLGYVQSAISRQIAYLEQTTGLRLIERPQGPRPVKLTEAGEALLQHAHDILASIEAAKCDIARMAEVGRREVRLGLFPGVPTRILPRALLGFARRHSDITVTVTEAATDKPLFELLQEGDIDLAFTCLPGEEGPFETREILRVPWALVVRADSDLGSRATPPSAAELAALPLIGATTPRLRSAVESWLRSEGGAPRIVFRSDVAETAQALAAAGIGAAVLPRLAIDESDVRVRVVELDELVPPLSLGLAWQRQRRLPPAVKDFRDVVQELCRAQAPQDGRRFVSGIDGELKEAAVTT